jgi:hypothetical protein
MGERRRAWRKRSAEKPPEPWAFLESISAQLDEDRAFAKSVDQAGPALNATIAKAKLHGLIVDRKESGAPGEFAALGTEAEVMDAIRRELGDAAANALVASLADAPEPEQPAEPEVEPRGPGPGDTLN